MEIQVVSAIKTFRGSFLHQARVLEHLLDLRNSQDRSIYGQNSPTGSCYNFRFSKIYRPESFYNFCRHQSENVSYHQKRDVLHPAKSLGHLPDSQNFRDRGRYDRNSETGFLRNFSLDLPRYFLWLLLISSFLYFCRIHLVP